MKNTPKGMRLHIGIFGRRNTGKSSLLNALTSQQVSIVSHIAGTTTDPVEKPMELLPLGPVQFIDTAGMDDIGALGSMRVKRSVRILDRTDIALLVSTPSSWGDFEEELLARFKALAIPFLIILNKTDIEEPEPGLIAELSGRDLPPPILTAAPSGKGISDLKEALIREAPDSFLTSPSIVGELINPGEMVVLVVPIDLEAPKGRLILPQVQTIRDILDHDACSMVVKERELRAALDMLKQPPALVVTDSQAFLKVAGDTPPGVPLTSFSILFARLKGDLAAFVEGALSIEHLQSGDRILIAEACTHHPIAEDIGRVKIPRWLRQYVGNQLEIQHVQGSDFPDDLSPYNLVIHCGSCTFNRKQLLSRILACRNAGVPITNYGVAISYTLGIFERALAPFPAAADILERYRTGALQHVMKTY